LGSKESILAGQTEKTNKQTNKALASEREKMWGYFLNNLLWKQPKSIKRQSKIGHD